MEAMTYFTAFGLIWATIQSKNKSWNHFKKWSSEVFPFLLKKRNRDIPFTDRKLTVGLPRPLTLAHVAIRILFMSFDIFSSRCLTYKCRTVAENFDFGKKWLTAFDACWLNYVFAIFKIPFQISKLNQNRWLKRSPLKTRMICYPPNYAQWWKKLTWSLR